MRLISATVRHYRTHAELVIEFDPARTVIGGPNESGKSTLVEAVHRALFLKSRITGETQHGMVSTRHPGHPEVEVVMEVAGRTWRVFKRFSGASGVTRLVDEGGAALHNEEAEARLAELLRVENVAGGRGAGDRVAQQWVHLWVWQGQAGLDPAPFAEAQQGSLIQRLQQIGGTAALQSDLDAAVAAHFASLRESLFTQAGKPKAGSDLESAERAAMLAEEDLVRARARMDQLQQAIIDLEQAGRELEAVELAIVALERDSRGLEVRGARLQELRRVEAEQLHAVELTGRRCGELDAIDGKIASFRRELRVVVEKLEPHEEQVRQLESALEAARGRAQDFERRLRQAGDTARGVRLHHELVLAQLSTLEHREALGKMNAKAARIAECRKELGELEAAHARVPAIDKAVLQKIQRLEAKCSVADASLQAMAAGLEVVASDVPVSAGALLVPPGGRLVLAEDTEVRVGSGVQLVVRPGGGIGLAEARETARAAHVEFRKLLDASGVTTPAEAVEAQARRDDLVSRIRAMRAELTGMGSDAWEAEQSELVQRLAASEAALERLARLVPDAILPVTAAEVRLRVADLEGRVRAADKSVREAQLDSDEAVAALQSAQAVLDRKREERALHQRNVEALQAQLRLLIDTHGEDAARLEWGVQARAALSSAEAALQASRVAIEELQPGLFEADRQRVRRALDQAAQGRMEARTRMAVARNTLRSDGTEDPQTALIQAEAKAVQATRYRDSVRRRAQAVGRLHQAFQDERRALADQFTRPLAERISGYLQCLFGPGARAAVVMEETRFSGIRLYRPRLDGAELEFASLSGGAREQVAAAVRLAMAEVLAADHGGCLPVVFDDAFAYSDPGRVRELQRMLDLAASRGLQVVVLTCAPADYAALGARVIMLG